MIFAGALQARCQSYVLAFLGAASRTFGKLVCSWIYLRSEHIYFNETCVLAYMAWTHLDLECMWKKSDYIFVISLDTEWSFFSTASLAFLAYAFAFDFAFGAASGLLLGVAFNSFCSDVLLAIAFNTLLVPAFLGVAFSGLLFGAFLGVAFDSLLFGAFLGVAFNSVVVGALFGVAFNTLLFGAALDFWAAAFGTVLRTGVGTTSCFPRTFTPVSELAPFGAMFMSLPESPTVSSISSKARVKSMPSSTTEPSSPFPESSLSGAMFMSLSCKNSSPAPGFVSCSANRSEYI